MSTGVGMSSCCLSGKIREGKPKGTEKDINGIPTYVAEPENGDKTKTIVFLVDIFGWTLPNVRLLADSYAAAGFTAYIPDVHSGDSIDESFLQTVEPPLAVRDQQSVVDKTASGAKIGATLGPWLVSHREAVVRPIIENFIDKVRYIPGTNKVGVIGFCWGGRYAILAAQKPFSGSSEGKGVNAAYACHPSLVSIPADFDPVAVPLSLALGDKDSLLGEKEVGQIREVMDAKKSGGQGEKLVESEVRIYKDQIHGFALRGDWGSEKDREAMDEAEKQGIEWFRKHLA
ncbi:hypothetical protein LTR91_023877 [Friedmanniomyces endolithicus]|uniref:Dienelactone hydrolase domain-containing protein n=1 Tax=Friedmanniomyces endolithicus TaxID=329885 RepID=A0AAN6FCG9_9PEZI|nr:hypothetical protein LTR35_007934 [Friedmanniomyces endolithicus]KAK0280926.1 hypothetical protein LTS00_012759 [Friedmanniomyces endolithicus]KAK0312544.1 hypothetical protein LTR82_013838 [Friedmanniomyces endolithicus]KAK0953379.1 hypothetical protein LTR91_023877 [Friedmanniomyces endolithicus]KAK1006712.1 hypothetical protein LTR54_006469 [Friedmanniomyces endolithicus]